MDAVVLKNFLRHILMEKRLSEVLTFLWIREKYLVFWGQTEQEKQQL